MPLDAVCLTALVNELAPQLEGAHIDKVQQPARDLLLLSLYTRQGSRKLLISAGVGMARLHLTAERFENPETPPMFCMLLRK
ncbi:MAG: NFACT family protein, partial [Oscillospiraceae bacterium]